MTRRLIALLGSILILLSGASAGFAAVIESSLPGLKWMVAVDLPGWTVDKNAVSGDGQKAMVRAYDKPKNNSSMFTLFIEPSSFPSAAAFRDDYAARLWRKKELQLGEKLVKVSYKDKRTSESGPMALFEHVMDADFGGKILTQKNIFGFLVRDGYLVRVHVSTTSGNPAEEQILQGIMKSVHFKEK